MDKALKAHLQEVHKSAAEHHTRMADGMSELANVHDAMSKASELKDPTGARHHKDACASCKKVAAHHVLQAEKCLSLHKAVGELPETAGGPTDKAAASGEVEVLLDGLRKLLNATVPTRVAANPTTDRPRVVVRAGQPSEAEKNSDPRLKAALGDIPS